MREIKFRIWDSKNEIMLDWQKIIDTMSAYDLVIQNFDNRIDRFTMQYTGLKDKNGVEIYEGDLVDTGEYAKYSVMAFNTNNYANLPAFHLCTKSGDSIEHYYGYAPSEKVAVMGNIHENPELLGEQQ